MALDCDIEPKNSWSVSTHFGQVSLESTKFHLFSRYDPFFDFFSAAAAPTRPCVSTGSLRLPTAALSAESDPLLSLTATSSVDGGSLTLGGEALVRERERERERERSSQQT